MIDIGSFHTRDCQGTSRRAFVRAAFAVPFAWGLPSLLGNSAPAQAPKARSILLIWLGGGPSHLDLFDPKPRAPVEYQLSCPKGYIVGGLDAELTDRWIDVTFAALLGSPVNPGVSTSRAALFTAVAVGRPLAAATFRPHIGCLPGSGGGQRTPTVVHVVPPGHPSTRRVWNVKIQPGTWQVSKTCAAGETLVGATHAVAFNTSAPPAAAVVRSVRASHVVHSGRVSVLVRAGAAVRGQKGTVQIDLTCVGGA